MNLDIHPGFDAKQQDNSLEQSFLNQLQSFCLSYEKSTGNDCISKAAIIAVSVDTLILKEKILEHSNS